MEEILAQARKVAEEAEVFVVTTDKTQAEFETNRLKHMRSKQSISVTLRIIKNGRIGCASTTRMSDGQELVDMAVETSQFGMLAKFELPGPGSYPSIEIYDPETESVPIESMVKVGDEMIAAVKGHTPEILCQAEVVKGVTSIRIINSRGAQVDYQTSYFNLGMEGTLVRGTDMLFVWEMDSSCHPILSSEPVSGVVIRQLELAREISSVSSRKMPVIFTPNGIASAFTPCLMSAFNGKTVLEGASPIGNRLGERAFDERLTLWDDPTLAYRPASRPCDDEGVASQRTLLIDQGKVNHFLYDLQTAGLASTRSTGNGVRSPSGLPAPSPSALVIAPGNIAFDDMVKDIKEGIIVEHLLGAGQSNVLGGDFSGNVLLGYKVEDGKIAGRVKNTMVSGNIYQILNQISAIGDESKWVGSLVKCPHIYCPSVSVTSKG